jgi:hypothetical protein
MRSVLQYVPRVIITDKLRSRMTGEMTSCFRTKHRGVL